MANFTIAIDCMGGDFGPSVTVPAVKVLLQNHFYDQIKFKLFGQEQAIREQLSLLDLSDHPRLVVLASDQDVLMTDPPSVALKHKKGSSMRLALESVRDGRSHACVSAGNTGALMALSLFVLRMLPGIDRPAIIAGLPTYNNKQVYLLDLGANVECRESRLAQFAIMGNELSKSIDGIESPRVGLLNIGEEAFKGSEKIRRAAELISQLDGLNFTGFVEGNQIFNGDFDVIVTDGFTGNNVLKVSEGLSYFLITKIKDAFNRNWWTKMVGFLAKPIIRLFKEEINPERYNGASLVGLRGIVIKSHGRANISATAWAIEEAILQAKLQVPSKIKESLQIASQRLKTNL